MRKICLLALVALVVTLIGAQMASATLPSPTIYYRFDDGSGTTAADATNNGWTGNLKGTLGANLSWVASPGGVVNGALLFNWNGAAQSGGYVNCYSDSNSPNLGWVTSFAITAWVQCQTGASNSGFRHLVSSDGWVAGSAEFLLNGGLPQVTVNGMPGGNDLLGTTNLTSTANVGKWFHVAVTYSPTGAHVFVNGVEEGARTYSTTTRTADFNTLKIGNWGATASRYFRGTLDDVRIYTTALTASQVIEDYGLDLPKIEGQVTGGGGGGIGGATVSYKLSSDSTWKTATADGSGNYSIPVPANTGPYDIKGGAVGYVTSAVYSPAPSVGTSNVTGINFTLVSAQTISGTVTAYGVAKAGATVNAYTGPGGTGTLAATATTDSSGNYTLNLAGSGTYYVFATLAGYQNSSETTVTSEPATGIDFSLTAVPLVKYDFDETSGTTAADSSGFGRNGTLTGTSSWQTGYVGISWCDSGAGSVTVPSLGTSGQFAIATWVNVHSLPPGPGWNGVSFVSADSWYSGTPAWMLRETGQIQISFYGIPDMYATGFTFTGANLGKWVHLALVYDKIGGSEKIYINGALNNSITFSGAPAAVLSALKIGSWNGNSRYINARFDDFRIYGAALPYSEVAAIYNYGLANMNPNISGTVSAADASSCGGLTVTLTPVAGPVVTTTTAADGTYSTMVAPGTHTVSASKPGYDTATSSPVTVPPSATDVDLVLNQSSYPITITLTDGTNPIPGAVVTVKDSGDVSLPVTDNGNGTYTVPSAINGIYTITAAKPGFATATDSVTVDGGPASKTITLSVALTPLVDYAFNETSGLAAADSSGNGFNGTLSATGCSWVAGKNDNAIDFNIGSVSVPSIGSLAKFTIAGWINIRSLPPGPDRNPASLVSADGWHAGTVALLLRETGAIQFSLDGAPGADLVYSNTNFGNLLNTWAHVAFTYGPTGAKIYVGGLLDQSAAFTTTQLADFSALRIGSWNGNERFFDGKMDDFKIYGRVLAESEIRSLAGFTAIPVNNLSELKANVGQVVQLTGNVTVTAAPRAGAPDARTTDFFFVGERQGLGCIRVVDNRANAAVAQANFLTDLIGSVTVDANGQYTITLVASVATAGGGSDIGPLGMNNKAARTDAKTLTNLVRIWGKVGAGTDYTLDDGYSAPISVNADGLATPATGNTVGITGILWKEGSSIVLYQAIAP